MARDVLAEFVIRQAKGIVSPDAGDVELTDIRNSTAYVRYKKGHNPRCVECVIASDDLQQFLTEMFRQHAPHIARVELEVVE